MPLTKNLTRQIEAIVQELLAYEPEKIILFGSVAQEKHDSYSDLDFVIIKKTTKPFLKRLGEVVDYLPLNGGSIDILVYTPEEVEKMKEEENSFIEHVLKDGRIIYEKS